jgi:hypothetical protein
MLYLILYALCQQKYKLSLLNRDTHDWCNSKDIADLKLKNKSVTNGRDVATDSMRSREFTSFVSQLEGPVDNTVITSNDLAYYPSIRLHLLDSKLTELLLQASNCSLISFERDAWTSVILIPAAYYCGRFVWLSKYDPDCTDERNSWVSAGGFVVTAVAYIYMLSSGLSSSLKLSIHRTL